MKKVLRVFLGILTVIGAVLMLHRGKYEFVVRLCVTEGTAVNMVRTAAFDTEDIRMQIVYQLARRSIVRVASKDAVGSGIIWKIDDGIVIASNRHLLMKDVEAEIVFGNGEIVTADIIGYSQQYDIGFVRIPQELVSDKILRDIYEVVPKFYESESEVAGEGRILQLGAPTAQNLPNISTGSIQGLSFVPLFNTNVLETAAYSRAGMSGGGVFDEFGHFLGMISGGEVSEEAQRKEADITYSIPPALIAAEYEALTDER